MLGLRWCYLFTRHAGVRCSRTLYQDRTVYTTVCGCKKLIDRSQPASLSASLSSPLSSHQHRLHSNIAAVEDHTMPGDGTRKRRGSVSRYEDAVFALNNLQSNAEQLASIRADNPNPTDRIAEMQKSLSHLGITPEDLNKLNVIHIAGTKGKGSTAALTESILRKHGYKTGFFSSPHLVEVRERIRLSGVPITAELFTHYFWDVYNTLKSQLGKGESMPPYFKFLTLLAFKIFLNEGITAAVLEVGIGGRYDNTNVVPRPVVCGITSLGIDHTSVLGKTIEEIAWQKAGIMKAGCPTVTVQQCEASMPVLRRCSEEVNSPLYEAPLFDARHLDTDTIPNLAMQGDVQLINASAAVQLARIFIDRQTDSRKWTTPTQGDCVMSLAPLDDKTLDGLSACKWPGRFHCVTRPRVSYYFDGAHTVDSITKAYQWFIKQSAVERQTLTEGGGKVKTVLMFNKTGDRSANELLTPIADQSSKFTFDYAVFCPNFVSNTGLHSDCKDRRVIPGKQLAEVTENKDTWLSLIQGNDTPSRRNVEEVKISDDNSELILRPSGDNGGANGEDNSVVLFASLNSALEWLGRGRDSNLEHYPNVDSLPYISEDVYLQVFVTGSVYLVGNSFMCLKEEVR